MRQNAVFGSLMLFVFSTSTLCQRQQKRINSTNDELSCGEQHVLQLRTVYDLRNPYCKKDDSTCSWVEHTVFSDLCPVDTMAQLISRCNGKNNCSQLYSILNDTKCCNDNSLTSVCKQSTSYDIQYGCTSGLKTLDLDVKSKTNISGKYLMIKAPRDPGVVCQCDVYNFKKGAYGFYYCATSLPSKNCTTLQSSNEDRNFTLHSNTSTSIRLDGSTGQLEVQCSCSSNDEKITSTLDPGIPSSMVGIHSTPVIKTINEKDTTDGNNLVIIISAVGGGLVFIVVIVVVVLLKKRFKQSSEDPTLAPVNREYLGNSATARNDAVPDDDGYCNFAAPRNGNSNVQEDLGIYNHIGNTSADDTYNHIGCSENRAQVDDDDTYNHIGQLSGNNSNRQAVNNAGSNQSNVVEQTKGGNSKNDETTYAVVMKKTNTNVPEAKSSAINVDEDDKTYAVVNKHDK